VAFPVATAPTSTASATARHRCTAITSRRLSTRSANAPETSDNTNQGSCCATAPPATRAGSEVNEAISNGPATSVIPSPVVDTADATHSLTKSAPRRGRLSVVTVRGA
jgi:hypothetical protein